MILKLCIHHSRNQTMNKPIYEPFLYVALKTKYANTNSQKYRWICYYHVINETQFNKWI